MSPCRKRNWGEADTFARLAREPFRRLSRTTTEKPRSMSTSTRCEPMKPAPPVTRMVWPVRFIAPTSVFLSLPRIQARLKTTFATPVGRHPSQVHQPAVTAEALLRGFDDAHHTPARLAVGFRLRPSLDA